MRDYAKVSPQFWTGDTGRQLRAFGGDELLVALYLLTCPSSNMIGLYHLALPTLCHETGSPFKGASKALRSLSEAQFAYYDEERETVWVPEMARHQIGETLKRDDKRVKAVASAAAQFRKSPFYKSFCDRYTEPFNLRGLLPEPVNGSPFEGPSKPLRSQEQEQEQEKEQEQEAPAAPPKDSPAGRVLAAWMEQTDTHPGAKAREQYAKRIKARLRDGCTEDQLLACVDFALRDDFYAEHGYAKSPAVIWKDAGRVADLCARLGQMQAKPNGAKKPSAFEVQMQVLREFVEDGKEA